MNANRFEKKIGYSSRNASLDKQHCCIQHQVNVAQFIITHLALTRRLINVQMVTLNFLIRIWNQEFCGYYMSSK
ncbi:hypothetical protein BH11BAC1_BH11BAC1_09300 [soil metagenome]